MQKNSHTTGAFSLRFVITAKIFYIPLFFEARSLMRLKKKLAAGITNVQNRGDETRSLRLFVSKWSDQGEWCDVLTGCCGIWRLWEREYGIEWHKESGEQGFVRWDLKKLKPLACWRDVPWPLRSLHTVGFASDLSPGDIYNSKGSWITVEHFFETRDHSELP